MAKIKDFLTIFDWLPSYQKNNFKGDLWAGITVGVMLVPQGMAYAMIAGLPPIFGLYAAFLPQVIYTLFGTSRQLSVAPAAMISLLVGAGIGRLATPGTDLYIHLAILLALIVGIIQLLLGLVRMGFLVNFLSHPVVNGYTSSAAIIIGLSQLKHLLGVDMPSSNLIHKVMLNTVEHLDQTNLITMAIGIFGVVLILVFKKLNRALPAPLIVVVLGVVVVSMFHLEGHGVRIVGEVPQGLPKIGLAHISVGEVTQLVPLALMISLIGFMESITIAKALQAKAKNYKVQANKELVGLGAANMVGAVFSAFPVSGGLGRSAVNAQAGARTNVASWISAAVVGATLVFFTPLFYYLPKAMLAAIIMVAVFGLIDIKTPFFLYKTSKKDFFMLLITFCATLIFGVQIGISTGVLLSLGLVIHRSVYPHLAVLGKLPDSNYYRNLSRFPEAIDRKDALIFRFDSELYFANIGYFKERLERMIDEKGSGLKVIVLNAQSIYAIDSSAAQGLEDIVHDCEKRGVEFYMTEVIGPVRDALRRTGLFDKIGAEHFKMRVQDALDHFDTNESKGRNYALQANE